MTNESDISGVVERWLDQGTRPLPTNVLDGAMATVTRTNQLGAGPGWPLWLSRSIAIAGWAVAVLAVAILAPLLLVRDGQQLPGGAAASTSAVPIDPLVGVWTATDLDGSAMTLTIAEGPADELQVTLVDSYAQGCDGQGATDTEYRGSARGVHRGDELHVVWVDERCGDLVLNSPPFVMTYDPLADELHGMKVSWTR